jgi:2,4-dienoyl-CoA reductase-like NADH-dependent reductase (Old Yellow Enzyme family)
MSVEILFEPLQLGAIKLRNRIVMAPMTRSMPTIMRSALRLE